MERLTYRSVAAPDLESSDVFEIVEASARKNPAREITGFLIYHEGRFFQFIEGPSESLSALLSKLESDTRHHSLEVVERGLATQRWFPDWAMKRVISFSSMPALEELRSTLSTREGGSTLLAQVEEFLAP